MSKPLLKVENLKVYFHSRGKSVTEIGNIIIRAVDGISFEINEGKTLGLVGESGCGKSTVGRAVVGLNDPNSGNISFLGKDILALKSKKDIKEIRKQMQFIFQDPFSSLNPRMKIGEIIGRPIDRVQKLDKDKKKHVMAKLIKDIGLSEDYLDRFPHEFSGGQRQRISIARALALNPKFIVADEPTSALDVSIQSQILNLLKDLKLTYNLSMLFISHDLEVVRYIADDIAVMYLGKLVEKGPCSKLFETPLHPYTKALLAAIPQGPIVKKKESMKLGSIIPSPSNPPSGCRLHTRCPFAKEICSKTEPEMKIIDGDRYVACHFYKELS